MNKGIWLASVLAGAAVSLSAATVDFEKDRAGQAPAGFSEHLTGSGSPGRWTIVNEEKRGNVLLQGDPQTNSYRFPHCIYQDFSAADVDLQVAFKAIAGKKDQAAGLVWRWQNSSNYYVVRANALEDNVVLYKMQDGKRVDLKPVGAPASAYGVKTKVTLGEWHKLRVLAVAQRFTVFLDGEKLFDVEDATFKQPGKIGVWTKADSVTAFDDLTWSMVGN